MRGFLFLAAFFLFVGSCASDEGCSSDAPSAEVFPDIARLKCRDVCRVHVTTKTGEPIVSDDGRMFDEVIFDHFVFTGTVDIPVFSGEQIDLWIAGEEGDYRTDIRMWSQNFVFMTTYMKDGVEAIDIISGRNFHGDNFGEDDEPYHFEVVRRLYPPGTIGAE